MKEIRIGRVVVNLEVHKGDTGDRIRVDAVLADTLATDPNDPKAAKRIVDACICAFESVRYELQAAVAEQLEQNRGPGT